MISTKRSVAHATPISSQRDAVESGHSAAARFGVRTFQGEAGERGVILIYPTGRVRPPDAVTALPGKLLLAVRLSAFLVSLYLLYFATLALTATNHRPGSTGARLAARARYALWQLEQRSTTDPS